jgi:hypothetical protein
MTAEQTITLTKEQAELPRMMPRSWLDEYDAMPPLNHIEVLKVPYLKPIAQAVQDAISAAMKGAEK